MPLLTFITPSFFPPVCALRDRIASLSGKRRRERLVGRRVVPRAPHRKWTRRFARLTARRGDGRGPIPARAEPRKRTHVAMQLSPHKSPISATWRPFWTTRVPLSVPATLLETPNDARRRKDGRTAANAMRSGQLRAKVVDLPIFLLIFWAGSRTAPSSTVVQPGNLLLPFSAFWLRSSVARTRAAKLILSPRNTVP